MMEFESADVAMRGEMNITFTLIDAGSGTDILAVHDNLPPGLSPADNETGWRMALDKLAAFVEVRRTASAPGAKRYVRRTGK